MDYFTCLSRYITLHPGAGKPTGEIHRATAPHDIQTTPGQTAGGGLCFDLSEHAVFDFDDS